MTRKSNMTMKAPMTSRMLNDRFFSRLNSEVEFFATTDEPAPTCRSCAEHVGISKSTVHSDLTERFGYILFLEIPLEDKYPYITKTYYDMVKWTMGTNFSLKHIRGGEATKKLFEEIRKTKDELLEAWRNKHEQTK